MAWGNVSTEPLTAIRTQLTGKHPQSGAESLDLTGLFESVNNQHHFLYKKYLLREKGAVYGEFIFEPLVDSPRLTSHVDIFRCRGFFRGKERE